MAVTLKEAADLADAGLRRPGWAARIVLELRPGHEGIVTAWGLRLSDFTLHTSERQFSADVSPMGALVGAVLQLSRAMSAREQAAGSSTSALAHPRGQGVDGASAGCAPGADAEALSASMPFGARLDDEGLPGAGGAGDGDLPPVSEYSLDAQELLEAAPVEAQNGHLGEGLAAVGASTIGPDARRDAAGAAPVELLAVRAAGDAGGEGARSHRPSVPGPEAE